MMFLADEEVDRQIVERLRLDGHEVAYITEMSPGIMDDAVLRESRCGKGSDHGRQGFQRALAAAFLLENRRRWS